ncbi:MAG: AAA family ATPase [Deltaproteobacteria bacterium]|nr:AAA family ATPase [Deltaproteobacteria bacterium]
MRTCLSRFTLCGFKTIRELRNFEPGSLTLLIGPNGAGKSNLISFFRLLSWALVPPGQLQVYVAQQGGASAILHDGATRSREIETTLSLKTDAGLNEYSFRLFHAANDTLVFADEWFRFRRPGHHDRPAPGLGAGHREAELISRAEEGNQTAGIILSMLRRIIVHQFHNTSPTARVRDKWDVDDGRRLKEDAANLAPFLYRLQQNEPKYYHRIIDTIRLILPFFATFELEPEYGRLLLRWREHGSDRIFTASQAADGMLRAVALVALLQQPERDLPDVLVLDEPELGLHPYAIEVLAGLLKSVANHVQVIVATQSVSLIDRFDPKNIVVTERPRQESYFRRLGEEEFADWLKEYTLSELWEKNVLGGRPSH